MITVNSSDNPESALFKWVADYQDDIGILCQTHPRLSRLIDDYIVLLTERDGLKGEAVSERYQLGERLTLKEKIIKMLVSAHRKGDRHSG